jgi:hypothetical protein
MGQNQATLIIWGDHSTRNSTKTHATKSERHAKKGTLKRLLKRQDDNKSYEEN